MVQWILLLLLHVAIMSLILCKKHFTSKNPAYTGYVGIRGMFTGDLMFV